MLKAILFDIQRFSVHDGPGVRTNLFFKGCPLRCDWCSNPESWDDRPQPLYEALKCIHCGACAQHCPDQAIADTPEQGIDINLCKNCVTYACADQCVAKALKIVGKSYTADELLRIVEKDCLLYEKSGGGITCSGGEPLHQAAFLSEFLKQCRERGINTAVETCLCVPWANVEQVLPFMNVFLCDLKHVDPQMMRQETGIDGALILNNIKRLAQSGAQIIARIPIIPDFNDKEEDIIGLGQFALDCGIHTINLLPYHRLGLAKHKKIFSTYRPTERRTLADENMNQHLTLLNNMGFTAEII